MTNKIFSDEKPQLAVIVPVYKVEKYLSKCLDSIINQTYKNLQIICVDDGSPDNCGDILEEYAKKDSRIIVVHKENGGLSSARNTALDLLNKTWTLDKGNCPELVTFVDSDDFLDLETYEKTIHFFEEDIDIVTFGFEKVTDSENTEGIPCYGNISGLQGKFACEDSVINSVPVQVWNKIFRLEIIFRLNLRFPDGLLFEDSFFTPLYLMHSRNIFFEQGYYYKYLSRCDSITGNKSLSKPGVAIHHIKVCEKLYSYLKAHNLFEDKHNIFWNVFFTCVNDAVNNVANVCELQEVYSASQDLINNEGTSSFSMLQRHMHDLILRKELHESNKYLLLGIVRIKHRVSCDKYYLFGVPVVKVKYNDRVCTITLLGCLFFRKKVD